MTLLNRARMTTTTTGTGTVTLGSAVTGHLTFAEAGAVNATQYSYCIEDGDDFEIGIGTYTSSGTTFSRDTVTVSKIGGTAGTSKISLSGTAQIFITARAADIARTDLTLAQFAATTSAQLRTLLSDETGGGANVFADQPTINNPVLGAGSTSQPSAKLTSGTLKTTPAAGDIEYDGDCIYGTVDAGNRGIIPCWNFVRLDANRNLTNTATEQAFFGSANDALTLEVGTYWMFGFFAMSSMSSTSNNCNFDILGAGTATLGTVLYSTLGWDSAANATAASASGMYNTAAQTSGQVAVGAPATALGFEFRGTFEVTGAGTVVPSISLTNAAAAVATAGSFFAVVRLGSNTLEAVGQWG